MKKIKVKLTKDGINTLIKEVNAYKKWLKTCTEKLVRELANEGMQVASVKFRSAVYDGTNDVSVSAEMRNDHKSAVVAVGNSVLFIEFGTGVTYPDDHPEALQNGMIRGGYGHGLGKKKNGWRYTGDPGTNGEVITEGKHAGEIHTFGNPANRCMYDARADIEHRFKEIVERCFR